MGNTRVETMDGPMQKILLISDGHGEDWVAAQIAHHLHHQSKVCLELMALPMVGDGHSYEQVGVPVALSTRNLPSGGFTFKTLRGLVLDVRAGLGSYGQYLISSALELARWADLIIAVGDILPMGVAWLTGKPFVFVGCTKSDYYTAGAYSCYNPCERVLMQSPRCLHTFTRDAITCKNLRLHHIPASYWGNPMMDGLEISADISQKHPGQVRIGLLPGSRPQEAQRNLIDMLACLPEIGEHSQKPVRFEAAISAGLSLESFHQLARSSGWQKLSDHQLIQADTVVHLEYASFSRILHGSDLLIAMAGTATEQAVGLGKPVVTIPGQGPQFTRRFARLQRQLLGESVLVVEAPRTRLAKAVSSTVWSVLHDRTRLGMIGDNGRQRMGRPGAAHQIAQYVLAQLPQSVRDVPRSCS